MYAIDIHSSSPGAVCFHRTTHTVTAPLQTALCPVRTPEYSYSTLPSPPSLSLSSCTCTQISLNDNNHYHYHYHYQTNKPFKMSFTTTSTSQILSLAASLPLETRFFLLLNHVMACLRSVWSPTRAWSYRQEIEAIATAFDAADDNQDPGAVGDMAVFEYLLATTRELIETLPGWMPSDWLAWGVMILSAGAKPGAFHWNVSPFVFRTFFCYVSDTNFGID